MEDILLLITGPGRAAADACSRLTARGYPVVHVADLAFGLDRLRQDEFGLVVVGEASPGRRLRFCEEARRGRPAMPILLLGATADELGRIGDERGPDDCVVRELDEAEVVARVRALLRRRHRPPRTEEMKTVEFGRLRLDPGLRSAAFEDRRVELTSIEFQLMSALAKAGGRPIARAQLLRLVWGYEQVGYSHTLTTHVNRVRTKLEQELGAPRLIETIRGIGYRLVDPDPSDAPARVSSGT